MESDSAPCFADATNFGLDDPNSNVELLHRLEKKDSRKIGVLTLRTGQKLDLLKVGVHEGSVYARYAQQVVLYIQYHIYHYSFLPASSITQTKLWRSEHLPITNTFSQRLFFNVVLKITGAVLNDKEHTPSGVEFWKRRTGEALEKGLNVALVDFGAKTYRQITSKLELNELLESTWVVVQTDNVSYSCGG
jgi:hypothetical protein